MCDGVRWEIAQFGETRHNAPAALRFEKAGSRQDDPDVDRPRSWARAKRQDAPAVFLARWRGYSRARLRGGNRHRVREIQVVAPSSFAALRASASRSSGEPFVPASPREQIQIATALPRATSASSTPPQPNSMSSGCAPIARSVSLESGIRNIRAVRLGDFVARDELDSGRVDRVQIFDFARASDVVGATNDRLHPT